ncbi:hypothetical protein JCM16303_006406 [Sporobolomyces ruberrimus]
MPLPRSQPVLSPTSPARHSPQRPMPTRSHHRQLNNVPGIINLPPSSKAVDAAYPHSTTSSSTSSSRHRNSTKLVHQSLGEKPAPTLDESLLGQDDEPKKRRRQKKSSATNPNAVDESEQASVQVAIPSLSSNSVDENGVDQSTPTKARRRRGRATRQTSPPFPESLLPAAPIDDSDFTSTNPPQADEFSSHAHSQSVPPELPPHHRNTNNYGSKRHSSSGDEWDMPGSGLNRSNEPKENLSWQQELFKSAPTAQSSRNLHHHKVTDSPGSRTGVAPRTTRRSAPTPQQHRNIAPRPALHPSLSDSNAATNSSSSNPSLNWQQEMLLQSDLQTSNLATTDRRVHSASPTKPTSNHVQSNSTSTMTPARQRQHRIKDSITFGLNDLDLSELHEAPQQQSYHNSPVSRHNSMRGTRTTPRRNSPPAVAEAVTPTKQDTNNLGPRYAGPTFHNSPAPSSLPVPSFVLRRQT